MQQESYDIIIITETWWDDSHDWSAAMDGYKLFRKNRQDGRGGGVALCLDSVELEANNDKIECLWIKISGKANKADILVGVCYRPPSQDDEVFNSKTGCPQDNWPLKLVHRDGDPNSPPVIQERTVGDLLSHLDLHKSMGPDGIHPRVMRKLAEELAKLLFIIHQQP
ncbi:hypothetical protein WISP_22461 [Willisornis vidua]|uniref:Uncharacterized protein n=1 Tax=Willisornis vidua TaxID=1566151 RepID=A0ABQ9DTS7_9PASS|nr:hypothetical protein WISP_22461 [Willisornis vidua]